MALTTIFRADGNAKIGAGHLMRCLTIAGFYRERFPEERVLFVCSDEASGALASEKGFEIFVTGGDFREPEKELPVLERFLGTLSGEKQFVVDSYYVTGTYLKALGNYGRVWLLDDLGKEAYPVDVVLNYNVFADRAVYDGLYKACSVKKLLGGEYVPLRPEFSNTSYEVRGAVREVLITTGGGDVDNIGGRILERLEKDNPTVIYHLVTGQFNPHYEELLTFAESRPHVRIEKNVKAMAALMKQCDVCISAGGTTVYEVSAIGVPLIVFSYAENQEALAQYIGEKEIAGFGGHYHKHPDETVEEIAKLFGRLCESEQLRRKYYDGETGLVDGQGADRIALALREG